jgi:hypothetical protein
MTPAAFRRIALSMPEAVEASHQGHPDFRVGGKVFATIGYPDERYAMVKLTPAQQAKLVTEAPDMFAPVPGGWGRGGSTNVILAAADKAMVQSALAIAWENVVRNPPAKRHKGGRAKAASGAAEASKGGLTPAFARVRAAARAAKLPEVDEGLSFGTPGLKVRGKFLMRAKDSDTLVFRCAIEEKEMLIAAAPDIYFETDHYKGYPAVLVQLSQVSDAELRQCLERAWRLQAPAKLVAQHDGAAVAGKAHAPGPGSRPRRTRRA